MPSITTVQNRFFGPGDVYVIEPGHNGWVLGDEEVVAFEFNSTAAQTYAKTD